MLVRALRSFAGSAISMYSGEERDLKADEAKRLIRVGHAAAVKAKREEKEVAADEDKSNNSSRG